MRILQIMGITGITNEFLRPLSTIFIFNNSKNSNALQIMGILQKLIINKMENFHWKFISISGKWAPIFQKFYILRKPVGKQFSKI